MAMTALPTPEQSNHRHHQHQHLHHYRHIAQWDVVDKDQNKANLEIVRCDGGEEDLTDNIMEYLVSGVTPTSLQSGRGEIAEELGLMV